LAFLWGQSAPLSAPVEPLPQCIVNPGESHCFKTFFAIANPAATSHKCEHKRLARHVQGSSLKYNLNRAAWIDLMILNGYQGGLSSRDNRLA
jgi:hypothetical protein